MRLLGSAVTLHIPTNWRVRYPSQGSLHRKRLLVALAASSGVLSPSLSAPPVHACTCMCVCVCMQMCVGSGPDQGRGCAVLVWKFVPRSSLAQAHPCCLPACWAPFGWMSGTYTGVPTAAIKHSLQPQAHAAGSPPGACRSLPDELVVRCYCMAQVGTEWHVH